MIESNSDERLVVSPSSLDEPKSSNNNGREKTKKLAPLFLLSCCLLAIVCGLIINLRHEENATNSEIHVGEALDVSDFLPHDPVAAREAAKVTDDSILPGVENFAAYATVSETKNRLFWWFCQPTKVQENEKYPVILWLQGGPGASSLFGMWSEIGPYELDANLKPVKRKVNWNEKYGLLFLDQPAGTGFSKAGTPTSYSNSSKEAGAKQIYNLLEQFYTMFPELLSHPFVIAGESYGGHYVSGAASYVQKMIKEKGSKIPLFGASIGNGWVDPVNQIGAYPDLLSNLGLVTSSEKAKLQDYCDRARQAIKEGDYQKGFKIWDEMINGDLYGYAPYVQNVTGLSDYFDFTANKEPARDNRFSSFVQLPHVRKAIHVGSESFDKHQKQVEQALRTDFMVSYRKEVEDLLNADYPVLIYNGQYDLIIGPAITERYLVELQWPGREKYLSESQQIWRDKSTGKVFGYIKSSSLLTTAVVRDASHMCPGTQPVATLDLITKFIHQKLF